MPDGVTACVIRCAHAKNTGGFGGFFDRADWLRGEYSAASRNGHFPAAVWWSLLALIAYPGETAPAQ
jgi:hypothetical protein